MLTPHQSIKYFLYARKSTESEDRQVASIDSQIDELQRIAQREQLSIVEILSESQSAKAPGRPVFNQMLQRITRGEACGILCWKLDRLARNPVDGGNVSWLLQQGGIQHIRTYERSYYPTDNVLLMSVELGMANQFIRDLSQNTKRGLRAKAQAGWYPGVAKPGYRNEPHGVKGERTIRKDPVRFPLMQKALRLILTGVYSPSQVLKKLNQEWGYRTPKHRKLGAEPLARSTFYRILSDPFYYGRFEYPAGSGQWYQGKHEPMITEDDFWRMQELLGGDGRQRPRVQEFAFTGMMRCGECGATVTAEVKEHVVCSICRRKFSARRRQACPQCLTPIAAMLRPIRRRYVYYHCSKRKNPSCCQPCLQVERLETQVDQLLATMTMPEDIKEFLIRLMEKKSCRDAQQHGTISQSLQETCADLGKRLDNLLKLKISPQNSNGELLSDEEFGRQKRKITQEMERFRQKMEELKEKPDAWLEPCRRLFHFSCYARERFRNGPKEAKRAILSALGSNLTIHEQNLNISLYPHIQMMQKLCLGLPAQTARFEPRNFVLPNGKNRVSNPKTVAWLRGWDDVRTFFMKEAVDSLLIPELQPCR